MPKSSQVSEFRGNRPKASISSSFYHEVKIPFPSFSTLSASRSWRLPNEIVSVTNSNSRAPLLLSTGLVVYSAVIIVNFYRAMHFSAQRGWDRMSSVRLSVTLVIFDHKGWKSWKLIARTISQTPSLFVDKRRSTYSQGNMGKFGGD